MFLKKLFTAMLRELSYSVFKKRFDSYAARQASVFSVTENLSEVFVPQSTLIFVL